MRFLDVTLPTLAENLALDEALLLAAEAGGPEVLRLWEWPTPAVVLGAACKLGEEVHEENCRNDAVPILRRSSGGGTVLLNSGCLLYSLVLSYDRAPELTHVRPSYRYILGRIRDALAPSVPGLELAGISDLAIAGRKVSGNAQQRKRQCLLHHGTLLTDFDSKKVAGYLNAAPRPPAYRHGRNHGDFLTNLPVNARCLKYQLQVLWQAQTSALHVPKDVVSQLVDDRFAREEWIRRR